MIVLAQHSGLIETLRLQAFGFGYQLSRDGGNVCALYKDPGAVCCCTLYFGRISTADLTVSADIDRRGHHDDSIHVTPKHGLLTIIAIIDTKRKASRKTNAILGDIDAVHSSIQTAVLLKETLTFVW